MTQAKAPTNGGVAIVLSGAGARGAYEAGALSVLLPFLKGDDCPRMVLGTSAGALNAAILASYLHLSVDAAAAALLDGWRRITPARVFSTPRLSVLRLAERRLRRPAGVAPGLLDTGPFAGDPRRDAARRALRVRRDARELGRGRRGRQARVRRAASPLSSSRRPARSRCRGRASRTAPTRLGPEHLMASSAFPLAFPAQWVGGAAKGWYVDGGIHLNTPLKPAIDLGADRILVIGATPWEIGQAPERSKAPNVMDGSGLILHALLVDSLRVDLASAGAHQPPNRRWGRGAPAAGTATPAAGSGRRVVRYCALNPSDDGLSDVAARVWPSACSRSCGPSAATGRSDRSPRNANGRDSS